MELLVLEQKWFQQLLMPSAQGNIEGEMSRREAIRVAAAGGQKGGAAPPPPPAASAEDANAAGAGGAAAEAPAPKVVKEKPQFDDLVFHGIIGTGTFGRVKLVQQKSNDRVCERAHCFVEHRRTCARPDEHIHATSEEHG